MPESTEIVAKQLKELLTRLSPLIEEHTTKVCPGCADVCCKQKHGAYRERDIIYLHFLNVEAPQRDTARQPEGPCEALGPKGCVLPRWMRPFKCTWYFCEPLLAELNEGPQRENRHFIAGLQEMVRLYDEITRQHGAFADSLGTDLSH